MALLAGVVLLTVPASGAERPPGTRPPPETQAQRIVRETIAAVRASEQGTLQTSLAPLPRSQRQVVAGPLAGRWTTCQLPAGFNPVHASVLPDGTVLLMAGSGNYTPDFEAGRFQSYLFAPDTCAATRLPTPGDLFCAGHANLPNGNVLVAGGTKRYDPFYGLRTSYGYDWVSKQVRAAAAHGRGRPLVPLGDPAGWRRCLRAVGPQRRRRAQHPTGDLPPQHPHLERDALPAECPHLSHMLPTAGGRLFFTGVAFGGSALQVGFLRPTTGSFQPVGGLDTSRRDEGASFFVPLQPGPQGHGGGRQRGVHGPDRPVRLVEPRVPGRSQP
jgi:hypothetical protein